MKNFIFTCIASLAFLSLSCEKNETKKSTVVTINVKNGSGAAQSGVDVYMYSKTVFIVQGNDPFFAHKTATTNSSGNASFDIINPDDVLWTSSNTSEDLYFGVVYEKDGDDKEKHVVVTLSEGDTKSANLVMN